jgi:mannose-1-phosphate guanylyltransferase / mannose-6-phosphate isomerase
MLVPVILSGGAGSRLWPVSREAYPKPFIRLADGKSLLQKTLERAMRVTDQGEIITVTNREYYFLTKDEYEKNAAHAKHVFLLEPRGRNTAPAIAMAAFYAVAAFDSRAQLLVLPAEHLINDQESFAEAARTAQNVARNGTLVMFGIKPTHPETTYGYVECGDADVGNDSHRVARFVENRRWTLRKVFFHRRAFCGIRGCFASKHRHSSKPWKGVRRIYPVLHTSAGT